jgi:hypothetical protein
MMLPDRRTPCSGLTERRYKFFTAPVPEGFWLNPGVAPPARLGGFGLHGQLLLTMKAGASCTAAGPLWLMGTLTWKSLRVVLPAASRTRSVTE